MGEIKRCIRCVMDKTNIDITFTHEGCNYCTTALEWKKRLIPQDIDINKKLCNMVEFIKAKRKNCKYDCIIGLSGGLDSSYALLKAKELGLRVLAVHVDAGWNTEVAVRNIEVLVKSLNIDLLTYVVDWEEMKELQKAFFLSGVVNCDTPQDHAYFSALMQIASRENVNYIITGQNWQSESILSSWEWDHMDSQQIEDIFFQLSGGRLQKYPLLNVWKYLFYFTYIKNIKYIRILDFLDYNTQRAKMELIKYGWEGYNAKHHESFFTKFYQSYYLPLRLGYDKRMSHLSSLIISGEISREAALEELKNPIWEGKVYEKELEFLLNKLGISLSEWEKIISLPLKSHTEYRNFKKLLKFRDICLQKMPRYSYIGPGYQDFMLN